MGFLKNLFGKKEQDNTSKNKQYTQSALSALDMANKSRQTEVEMKESGVKRLTNDELMALFVEYFAPNKDFYSQPGSDKFKAYFGAINAATLEMLNAPGLFEKATKRNQSELLEMINNKVPGITNSLICGLIFSVGDYCVIRSNLICVDFSENLAHCAALYLLLTARKMPKEKRRQMISAGEGTDTAPLTQAMQSLQILDEDWKFSIF